MLMVLNSKYCQPATKFSEPIGIISFFPGMSNFLRIYTFLLPGTLKNFFTNIYHLGVLMDGFEFEINCILKNEKSKLPINFRSMI